MAAFNVGDRVQTLIENNRIEAGAVGVVTSYDSWVTEEYPFVVTMEDGRSAAYTGRGELRAV
jgi:hypothetical protein